jgi:glycosyltransferase involved in cell wall biosynthesis
VLGTPIGATPEILAPLDPLLLFRDASVSGIADGLDQFLRRLAADPARADALRASCRRYAESHYGWERSVTALEGTLDTVAARAPRLVARRGEASA